ncbi:telomerase activating protein Est1 [Striga asiatica]|uniref:Telomerase activating protein Est1 n=1 Tax=Striga asiatica TaxID=4170 RepID=A0A5A7QET8_STRAF|nr:telomerase activating protein Est1 [Striga asiatica]
MEPASILLGFTRDTLYPIAPTHRISTHGLHPTYPLLSLSLPTCGGTISLTSKPISFSSNSSDLFKFFGYARSRAPIVEASPKHDPCCNSSKIATWLNFQSTCQQASFETRKEERPNLVGLKRR